MSPPSFDALLLEPFNQETGLWTQASPGHTAPVAELTEVHSGPNASSRLIVAAQRNELKTFPTTEVLQALSDLQIRDQGPFHGACKWYAEEPGPVDTNASFFISLNLIVLQIGYGKNLTSPQQELLMEMHRAFEIWFMREVDEGKVHYPNKYAGDLVCLWLLREILGKETKILEDVFLRSAVYWKESHWGWGEHLSDIYSSILLDELSCLLLMARTLPADIRSAYTDLFRDLLQLEDLFQGGPRVPTIRCYALEHQCPHESYREKIRPIRPDEVLPAHNPQQVTHLYRFPIGQLLFERGWQNLAGPVSSRPSSMQIPCTGGHFAHSVFSGIFRLGALSQFPVMPNTDHAKWGLSWQTMPVGFSSEQGDWGFLCWQTKEQDIDRCHPARNKQAAYLHNALTETVTPPIVGKTRSVNQGTFFLVERRMPQISNAWQECSDSFWLHGFSGTEMETTLQNGWHRLTFHWDLSQKLTLYLHPLGSKAIPELEQTEDRVIWKLAWPTEEIANSNQLVCLWGLYLGEDIPPPPTVTKQDGWYTTPQIMPGEAVWEAEWQGVSHQLNSL